MSSEPRFPSRRKTVEPDEIFDDYDQRSSTSWGEKLDAFAPAAAKAAAEAQAPTVEADTKPNTPRLEDTLQQMIDFDGAMCVALVDSDSGMILGRAGSGVDIDLAAAGASVMLRARRSTIKTLGLSDTIDDLLVTLTTQLQIIRPLAENPSLFLYLVVDRAKSSLAMARFKSTEAAGKIAL